MNLRNYQIIILNNNHNDTIFTVMKHSYHNYNIKIGTREKIIKDVNCLWNRTDINKLVGSVELKPIKIVPILKKYTHTNNLSKCYFVWANDFKNFNI